VYSVFGREAMVMDGEEFELFECVVVVAAPLSDLRGG
jgi:hypothetical protein